MTDDLDVISLEEWAKLMPASDPRRRLLSRSAARLATVTDALLSSGLFGTPTEETEGTEFDKPQNDAEIALFVAIESLLNDKHEHRDWNPSTAADEIVDVVTGAGWNRPAAPVLSPDGDTK